MRKQRSAWNKGRLLGREAPLKPKENLVTPYSPSACRQGSRPALFNLPVDSKLRGCDLVSLRVRDVYQGSGVSSRTIVVQRKTHRSVQFEITEATREAVAAWVARS